MLIVLLLSITTCAPVISKQLREQVRPGVTFNDVLKDPERYQGQMVILSGVIIEAKNTREGTLLQVLQRPAGFRGKPKDIDETEGRFLALDSRYLDVYVYAKGREVTVAGEVQGKRILPLDKTEYTYPLIYVKEIYLWPVTEERYYAPYYHDDYWWWRSHFLPRRKHLRSKKCQKNPARTMRHNFFKLHCVKSKKEDCRYLNCQLYWHANKTEKCS
jgi:outer membrane lipoprotein